MTSSDKEPPLNQHTSDTILSSSLLLSRILEDTTDAMITMDASQRILLFNKAAERLFCYKADQVVGKPLEILIPELARGRHSALVEEFAKESTNRRPMHERAKLPALCADNREISVEVTISKLMMQGQLLFTAVLREAMEDQTTNDLRDQRLRSLTRYSTDAMVVVDERNVATFVGPTYEAMLGYSQQERLGQCGFDFVHEDDLARYGQVFSRVLEKPQRAEHVEARFRHKNGEWRWVDLTLTNLMDEDEVKGIVINGRDITDRKVVEAELFRQVMYDSLTGLPNRRMLENYITHSSDKPVVAGAEMAVLFLDLDKFKDVNDSLGHEAGDDLLIEVATRLRSLVRIDDTISRVGGDDFMVIVPGNNVQKKALSVAHRIHQALKRPVPLRDTEIYMSVSIGIAISPIPVIDPERLIADADAAMYQAKRKGGNRTEVFSEELRSDLRNRLTAYAQLRTALHKNELVTYFQPIIDLRTKRIVSHEALIRWQHPTRGLLPPIEFLSYAEDSGLIHEMGEWILDDACKRAAFLYRTGELQGDISVNASVLQLESPTFHSQVRSTLRRHSFPPELLVIEITESVFMSDIDTVAPQLEKLHRLGVKLAVDDFGVGYSSLQYLRRLPIDILKIDMSFISKIESSPDDRAIVAAMISMAHQLDLKVIAEGVEKRGQASLLAELHCDYVQGYLYGRPSETMLDSSFVISDTEAAPSLS